MKILQLATHLNTGGITSYLYTLGKGLSEQGEQVYVASSGGEWDQKFRDCGIHIYRFNLKTRSELHPKIYSALIPLKKFVMEHNIDVIHLWMV